MGKKWLKVTVEYVDAEFPDMEPGATYVDWEGMHDGADALRVARKAVAWDGQERLYKDRELLPGHYAEEKLQKGMLWTLWLHYVYECLDQADVEPNPEEVWVLDHLIKPGHTYWSLEEPSDIENTGPTEWKEPKE